MSNKIINIIAGSMVVLAMFSFNYQDNSSKQDTTRQHRRRSDRAMPNNDSMGNFRIKHNNNLPQKTKTDSLPMIKPDPTSKSALDSIK